jgi:putative flippase GtrA
MCVSALAFSVDIGTLALLTEAAGLHYLLSAALSFVLGTSVSYALSIVAVFEMRRWRSKAVEYLLFVAVGAVGLGLNELLLWALTEGAGIFYLLSKLLAAAIVFFWNFGARKFLLFTSR